MLKEKDDKNYKRPSRLELLSVRTTAGNDIETGRRPKKETGDDATPDSLVKTYTPSTAKTDTPSTVKTYTSSTVKTDAPFQDEKVMNEKPKAKTNKTSFL